MTDRILTINEVADRLGLSERTVERLTDLPKIRLSARRIGYVESRLDRWIADRMNMAEAA